MCIVIEGEIVEDNHSEELQNFYRSSFDVLTDDVSTFLITEITIFEIATTISISQSKSNYIIAIKKYFQLRFTQKTE